METISNVANAAVKAVWGEQETNKEPVSGVSGDVSKGEPYDAGNLDPASQQKKVETTSSGGTQTTSSSLDPTSTGKPTYDESHLSQRSGDKTSTDPISAGSALTGQPPAGQGSSGLHSTSSPQRDTPVQTDTYSGPRDTTAGQSDIRDSSKAAIDPSNKQDVDINTPGPTSEGRNLTGSGAGPRPLEVVANEHGGDAGLNKKQENISSSNQSSRSENQPEKKSEYHDPKEDEYIKATGFAADGGDFDASKPGAGREADRLYDEKQHRGGLSGASESQAFSQESGHHGHYGHSKGLGEGSHGHGHGHEKDSSEKPSLGERIKAKLHKH